MGNRLVQRLNKTRSSKSENRRNENICGKITQNEKEFEGGVENTKQWLASVGSNNIAGKLSK